MSGAIPVSRGCGTRVSGGIYLEVGVSAAGLPLENHILDPPILLPADLGVSPIGVTLIPQTLPDGDIIWHVADWVGENNYPNLWDFLAEGRLYGFSRRLPRTLDFSKLDERSRFLPVHHRAVIVNATQYSGHDPKRFGTWAGYGDAGNPEVVPNTAKWRAGKALYGGWSCPKGHQNHSPLYDPQPACAGIWSQDTTNGAPLTADQRKEFSDTSGMICAIDGVLYPADDPRLVYRALPSVQYVARRAPEAVEPRYAAAFFASLPISRIVVIQGEGDADSLGKANASKLNVNVVQE